MNISSLITSSVPKTTTKIDPINWNEVLHNLLGKSVHLVITSLIFFIIWRIGRNLINKFVINNSNFQTKMTGRRRTLSELSINLFQYTLLFFYLYGALSILGLPVGTLLASAGIVSLAIGMGAQGFVSDLVNGMNILSEGQFDVGDIVKIGNYTGTVVSLGLRTTRLKSSDGTVTYIPNRNITVVENVTRGGIGVDVKLQLNAENDLNLVNQAIKNANKDLEGAFKKVIKRGPIIIGIVEQDGLLLTYQIHFQVVSGSEAKVKNAYLTKYIEELQKEKIKFN